MIKNTLSLPNILTLGNLFCGVLSIYWQNLEWALWLLFISLLLDLLDGWTARKLNQQSELGIQLDSLADLVSFGVAPAIHLMNISSYRLGDWNILAGMIVIFSALRLARFNLMESKPFFTGLPTPANALFIFSFVGLHLFAPSYYSWIDQISVYTIIITFSSFALILPIRLISFKGTQGRYLLLGGVVICVLAWFFPPMICLAIPFYLLSGFLISPSS